jgi:hypothetical protein
MEERWQRQAAIEEGEMTEGKWLQFVKQPRTPGRKTDRWAVLAKNNGFCLGTVSWFGSWRKYSFYPVMNSILEEQCLRDIAEFCQHETAAYKAAKKAA